LRPLEAPVPDRTDHTPADHLDAAAVHLLAVAANTNPNLNVTPTVYAATVDVVRSVAALLAGGAR
jgi:hypothetical protein